MARKSQKHKSRTSAGKSNKSLQDSQLATDYLSPLLPTGWERYFSAQRAGKYWGLSITCPVCGERPASSIKGGRRWRWLSVHISKHK